MLRAPSLNPTSLGRRQTRLAGGSIDRAGWRRQIIGVVEAADAEIMFRMLIVILWANSIVASFCFPRQGEVALGNLEGAAADAFGRAVAVE